MRGACGSRALPHEGVLATWIDGRAVLLAASLDDALSESECVKLPGVAPMVCGVLGAFGLSPERFGRHIEVLCR